MNGTSVGANTDGFSQVFGLLLTISIKGCNRMILFFKLTSLRVNMNSISFIHSI